jgi:uncharacterized membrane protein
MIRYIFSRIIRGFVLFFPLAITLFLLVKVVGVISSINASLVEAIPRDKIGLIPVATLISVGSLLLLFLLLGVLLAPRRKSSSSWLERRFLNFIPGYSLIRGTVLGAVGDKAEGSPRVGVLRRTPGVEEVALIVRELDDGRLVLFLPSAPSPGSGKLIVVQPELVEVSEAPIMAALRVFTDWGDGVEEVLPAASGTGGSES